MWTETVESAPGTVTQVRSSAQALIRFAKTTGTAVILVGHVTKDGQIAGPRVVEHMVDAVASFEGDQGHHFRILRAVKNRFGPTDEIGVFEMTDAGLAEVPNPSALFLAGRDHQAAGTAVFAGMEGTRPLLVEIQALVAPSSLGMPRRAVVGWDPNRLSMVLAVLEAHGGIRLGTHDVYLNVAGGLRITEPAADLAVAAALVSSLSGAVLPPETVYFGEIGLSGAIRPVAQAGRPAEGGPEARLRQGADPAGARRGRQGALRWRRCATSPTSWRGSARARRGRAPASADGSRHATPTRRCERSVAAALALTEGAVSPRHAHVPRHRGRALALDDEVVALGLARDRLDQAARQHAHRPARRADARAGRPSSWPRHM